MTHEDKRLDTFGGVVPIHSKALRAVADEAPKSRRANVALTADQWGAVCVAVHHGFEAVLRRADIPIVAQSQFSKDIEAAMAEITASLKAVASKE